MVKCSGWLLQYVIKGRSVLNRSTIAYSIQKNTNQTPLEAQNLTYSRRKLTIVLGAVAHIRPGPMADEESTSIRSQFFDRLSVQHLRTHTRFGLQIFIKTSHPPRHLLWSTFFALLLCGDHRKRECLILYRFSQDHTDTLSLDASSSHFGKTGLQSPDLTALYPNSNGDH
ncbi:hypothetical protein LXL04_017269 [Taraxacum kok-saghyz]